MGKYLIGIDAGTTKIKAVLFDRTGHQIAEAAADNRVINSNGSWNEQDMDQLWETLTGCVRNLVGLPGVEREQIDAIGLSAQGEGLWPLDAQGNTICNAILWNDGRAADTVAALKKDRKLYEDLKLRVGSYVKPGSTVVQIKWLAENRPELYQKAACIFTCKDYLRYRMTGEKKWELTDASCSCLDLATKQYPVDLFERLGIGDAVKKLPPLMGSTDCGGRLTQQAAQSMGLTPGLPVSGGMIDVVATAVGVGAIETNSVCTTLGTTGMNLMTVERYEPDLVFNGWECHMESGKYVKGMGMMSAMPNQDWVLHELFGEKELNQALFARLAPILTEMEPGEGGLLYLPHIDPSGERAPFFDPNAAAQIMGIKTTTTKEQILHAVMEGVCLGIRSCLEGIPDVGAIMLSGGGAKSDVWSQMLADCTGRDVVICEATELAAKGAALSAAMMIGVYADCASAKDFYQIKKTIRSDRERKERYDAIYAIYKRVQDSAKEFWQWRAEFLRGK